MGVMSDKFPHLTAYSEEHRKKAMDKYRLIAPYLNRDKSLRAVAEDSDVSKRTLQYWVSQYEQFGLVGLIRKRRRDSGVFKVEKEVQEEIKNLILNHKRNSVTSIHRKICEICKKNNWKPPSYYQVYAISRSLSPGLKKLAYEGKKSIKTRMI